MTGNELFYLEKGDYITIEIRSDKVTDITFQFLTTMAGKFYN
jgi:hypothetical protein